MGAAVPEGEARFVSLRKAYEDAFRGFSLQVHLLQSLMSQPPTDGKAIPEAKRRVEQAHIAYRESRDLLAQFMLSRGEASAGAAIRRAEPQTAVSGNKPNSAGTEMNQESRVERLAYQLWEEAGRPWGQTEEHWYRAERLIHSTA